MAYSTRTRAPQIIFFAFLTDLRDVTAIKKAYKTLCFQNHPDLHRDASAARKLELEENLKQINLEYEWLLQNADGAKSQTAGGEEYTYKYKKADEQGAADILTQIIRELRTAILDGSITIDLIGTWIWIYGTHTPEATRPYSGKLGRDGLNLHWHGKRLAWYYKPEGHYATYSGKSLSDLGAKYGRTRVSDEVRSGRR